MYLVELIFEYKGMKEKPDISINANIKDGYESFIEAKRIEMKKDKYYLKESTITPTCYVEEFGVCFVATNEHKMPHGVRYYGDVVYSYDGDDELTGMIYGTDKHGYNKYEPDGTVEFWIVKDEFKFHDVIEDELLNDGN